MPRLRAISVSALPSTVYETSPSTSSGPSPASASAAWIASTARGISLRAEAFGNSVAPMPAMAVRFESQVWSMVSTPHRAEHREGQVRIDGHELDLDWKADVHRRRVDPDEVAHQARPLGELDEDDDVARIEPWQPGLGRPAVGVDGSPATGLHRVGCERATGGTHRARRVPQPPAPRATLDQELAPAHALPEEEVVAMDSRPRSHHSGSRSRSR